MIAPSIKLKKRLKAKNKEAINADDIFISYYLKKSLFIDKTFTFLYFLFPKMLLNCRGRSMVEYIINREKRILTEMHNVGSLVCTRPKYG